MATQAEVARHLDLSQPAVSDLLGREVLPAAERGQLDLDACRVAYVRHLREQAAGRSESETAKWRGEIARQNAIKITRENEIADRKVIPMDDAVRAMQEANGHARAKLLSIPTKAAPILAAMGGKPQAIKERLTEFIHECLAELSRTTFLAGADSVRSADGPGGDGGEPGGADLGPAAETDGKRVG